MTAKEGVRLQAIARAYLDAEHEYSARLNDPEGYLPVWTPVGGQRYDEACQRAKNEEQRFRQATGMMAASSDQLRVAAYRLVAPPREVDHAAS